MPRKADPNLEKAIVNAAVRILDKRGIEAVTMRDVARAAGTTTPTLYERFADRDALLVALLDHSAYEMMGRMEGARNVLSMCEVFLDYSIEFPHRLDLVHKVWPRFDDRKRPTYDLAVERIMKQHGHSKKNGEEIAQSIIATLMGSVLMMVGAGLKSKFSEDMRRRTLKSVKKLCEGI
jgi:AcrR family transcriptional regulator